MEHIKHFELNMNLGYEHYLERFYSRSLRQYPHQHHTGSKSKWKRRQALTVILFCTGRYVWTFRSPDWMNRSALVMKLPVAGIERCTPTIERCSDLALIMLMQNTMVFGVFCKMHKE